MLTANARSGLDMLVLKRGLVRISQPDFQQVHSA